MIAGSWSLGPYMLPSEGRGWLWQGPRWGCGPLIASFLLFYVTSNSLPVPSLEAVSDHFLEGSILPASISPSPEFL